MFVLITNKYLFSFVDSKVSVYGLWGTLCIDVYSSPISNESMSNKSFEIASALASAARFYFGTTS